MKKILKQNFLTILLPIFGLCYTVIIFGTAELYMSNKIYLDYKLSDFWFSISFLSIFACLFCSVLLSFFKGKTFDYIVTLFTWLLLCCYLQGNILNKDLGTLDGSEVEWNKHQTYGISNLLIWVILLFLFIFIYEKKNKLWKAVSIYLPLFLIAIQSVALIALFLSPNVTGNTSDTTDENNVGYYISAENALRLSNTNNIIMFVLDNYGNGVMELTLKDYPDALKDFQDFTRYTNCSCSLRGTFPGLCTLVTGISYNPELPWDNFFDTAWEHDSVNQFFNELHQKNYETFIYTPYDLYISGTDIQRLVGKFDNVISSTADAVRNVNQKEISKRMIKLSFYRYSPYLMKKYFWMSTTDFSGLVSYRSQTLCLDDDVLFYNRLLNEGISLESNSNSFSIYHLRGPHGPYEMNENCQYSEDSTQVKQAMGSLKIVEEFLTQMKAQNIYNNAIIIITADHGTTSVPSPILFIKMAGETHSEMETCEAPITPNDLLPSIYSIVSNGEILNDTEGKNIFSIRENEERLRSTSLFVKDDDFEYFGNYSAVYTWTFTDHARTYDYTQEPTQKTQIKDGFYR